MKTDNIIVDRSFDFALGTINLYQELIAQKEFVLSKQFLRSGTSIGANVEEAIAAQSRADFKSKMAIACKEARETRYWIRLLEKSNLTTVDLSSHLTECEALVRILTSIVKSISERNH